MDKIKTYLIETCFKTLGPSAIRAGMLGIVGWLAARNGMLDPFGIHTASGITTIDWAKVSLVAIAGLPAIAGMILKLISHHGADMVNAVKGPAS